MKRMIVIVTLTLVAAALLAACKSGFSKPSLTETNTPGKTAASGTPQESSVPPPDLANSENPYPYPPPIPEMITDPYPYPVPQVAEPEVYPAPAEQVTSSVTPSLEPDKPELPVNTRLEATNPIAFRTASGKVQLVEFFAEWDGTSRLMAGNVNGLEAEYGDRMNFSYLDIDDPATDGMKQALGYRYQPYFVLLNPDGEILQQWQGRVKVEEFRNAFNQALKE